MTEQEDVVRAFRKIANSDGSIFSWCQAAERILLFRVMGMAASDGGYWQARLDANSRADAIYCFDCRCWVRLNSWAWHIAHRDHIRMARRRAIARQARNPSPSPERSRIPSLHCIPAHVEPIPVSDGFISNCWRLEAFSFLNVFGQ